MIGTDFLAAIMVVVLRRALLIAGISASGILYFAQFPGDAALQWFDRPRVIAFS